MIKSIIISPRLSNFLLNINSSFLLSFNIFIFDFISSFITSLLLSTKHLSLIIRISFRCIYDIKDINEIQIINDRNGDNINEEIKSKIKILKGNKKEELIFTKKFDKLGCNIIDCIIEGKLTNISYIIIIKI